MNLVTQSSLARQMKISRQAVSKAIQRGQLDTAPHKGKNYVNLDGPMTIIYINSHDHRRDQILSSTLPPLKPKKKPRKVNAKTEKKQEISTKPEPEQPSGALQSTDEIIKLQERYLRGRVAKIEQETIRKKLENAYKRGELISREAIYKIMYYLDRIAKRLELLGDVFLSDTGDLIITAGKVTPEIRRRWIDGVLAQIDEAKEETIKHIQKIEKEQAE